VLFYFIAVGMFIQLYCDSLPNLAGKDFNGKSI